MTDIGRKIYYELSTGNVIVDIGERTGDVVETTEAQDFQIFSALQPYQQSAVGVLQLTFGQDAQNFATYPYHVDVTQNPPAIAWDTSNPIGAKLADVQASKIAQLRNMYNQTLASGFNVTIGTTQYTFGWADSDITHMNALQNAITEQFLSFPVQYADVNGNPVSIPDQSTLTTIQSAATKFMIGNHQQVLTLIGQAKSATTTTAVNSIQWTPASY